MSTKPNLLAEFGLNREALAKLSKRKQLLFALLLFDRILPLLLRFSKRTGFDIAEFLKARTSLWDSLTKGSEKKKSNWSSTRRICLKNAPDTEAYNDKFVSHALNASLSLANILNFAQKGRLDDILEVVAWVRDSIDLHIQYLDPSPVSSPDVWRVAQA